LASASGWRAHGPPHQAGTPAVPGWIQWLRKDQRILRMAFNFSLAAISFYLFVGAMFVSVAGGHQLRVRDAGRIVGAA
jgi:hypothetical protein